MFYCQSEPLVCYVFSKKSILFSALLSVVTRAEKNHSINKSFSHNTLWCPSLFLFLLVFSLLKITSTCFAAFFKPWQDFVSQLTMKRVSCQNISLAHPITTRCVLVSCYNVTKGLEIGILPISITYSIQSNPLCTLKSAIEINPKFTKWSTLKYT